MKICEFCEQRAHIMNNTTAGLPNPKLHKNTNNVKILLLSMLKTLNKIKKWDWNDKIYSCLNEAIITSKDSISSKTLKKLKPVLKRRFSL